MAEDLETAARAVLSAAQDLASEATTEPWPGGREATTEPWPGGREATTEPWPGGREAGPALSDARVAGGELRAWFGPEGEPVLALAPIPLA